MPARVLNKLTDRKIRSLCKSGKTTAVSDGGGLTLTISANGYASWVLRYRFGGKAREISIGGLDEYPLAKAREERGRVRQMISEGVDPAKHKRNTMAAQALSTACPDTFQDLALAWFDRRQRKRLEHPEVVEGVLRRHVFPRLGKMALSEIRPIHIIDCLHAIADGGAPTVANDARRHIRKIFDYGVLNGELDVNPAAQITHEVAGHAEPARDRALNLNEIRKLYRAMERERQWFGRDNEITIQLLLMLGVRKGELIKARWGEFNLDTQHPAWTIPKSRIKTRKRDGASDFTIPLSPQTVDLFKELKVRACGSEWVLPARRIGSRRRGHISPDTINFSMARLETGLEPFTIHDLRRTMRSQLSALGIPFAVAERCLNHRLPGQGEIYDRHDFMEQRAEALKKWADTLDVLIADGVTVAREYIGGAKIIEIRRTG